VEEEEEEEKKAIAIARKINSQWIEKASTKRRRSIYQILAMHLPSKGKASVKYWPGPWGYQQKKSGCRFLASIPDFGF